MNTTLKREIIKTSDGSTTIHFPEINEQYHSKHGAINEANHVFIKHGLNHILNSKTYPVVHILEIGFGTGLNAFLTYLETQKNNQYVTYTGIEAYPIKEEEIRLLNYVDILSEKPNTTAFKELHRVDWEIENKISPLFSLIKKKQFFQDITDTDSFDLIYFDAFGARVQPELWSQDIFQKMYDALHLYGVLVTYAAKGSVRRAMQKVGFVVERLPGPPGKREMLRATKQ